MNEQFKREARRRSVNVEAIESMLEHGLEHPELFVEALNEAQKIIHYLLLNGCGRDDA